jgi:hypothetical protein
VRLAATRAYPGAAMEEWRTGDDAAVLSAWGDLFDVVLASMAEGDLAVMPYEADVHADLPPLLFAAYTGGEVSREFVVERHAEKVAAHRIFALPGFDPRTEVGKALDTGLSRLERLGVVTTDGDAIRLTQLAVWKLNALYTSFGWDAPSVGDLAGADTMTRLAGLSWLSEDDAETEVAAWLDGADHATLAGELAEALDEVEPRMRPTVIDLLFRLGEAAAAAVGRLVDTRWWRYAAAWYEQHGLDAPRPLAGPDRAWLLAEHVAATLDELDGDDEPLRDVLTLEPATDTIRLYDDLSRSDHPRAADVLEALSRLATDKEAAKAARKAAFKARSR